MTKNMSEETSCASRQELFTFIPDQAVTNSREFTEALFAYAAKQDVDLVITKEGMYPEFTIDGIAYTAERLYKSVHHIPVAVIRCKGKHPEDFEQPMPEERKKMRKLLRCVAWAALAGVVLLILFVGRRVENPMERWVLGIASALMVGVGLFRFWLYHYNDKQ